MILNCKIKLNIVFLKNLVGINIEIVLFGYRIIKSWLGNNFYCIYLVLVIKLKFILLELFLLYILYKYRIYNI